MEYVTAADIKAIRSKMGLSQAKFAMALGVKNGSSVKHWERGEYLPTGERYNKMLELKRNFLGTTKPAPQMSLPETKEPEKQNFDRMQLFMDAVSAYKKLNAKEKSAFKELII